MQILSKFKNFILAFLRECVCNHTLMDFDLAERQNIGKTIGGDPKGVMDLALQITLTKEAMSNDDARAIHCLGALIKVNRASKTSS